MRSIALPVLLLMLLLTGCGTGSPRADDGVPTATTTDDPPVVATDVPTQSAVGEESDWETYTNERYGFSLRYPPTWTLMAGQNFLSLNQGTIDLVVGYRHVTEDRNICCREQLPEGELVEQGAVACAGQEIDRTELQCEGETKAVIYQHTEEVAVGDLRFLFYLEDFSADYDAATIPGDVQATVDRVIGSLETLEPAVDFATATPRPTTLPPTPEPTPEQATAAPPTATPLSAFAEADSGGANVRSGPGTEYGLNGFLEAGERVQIEGRHGEWWQIIHQGRRAWVYDGVVTASDTDGVPQVETLPTPVPSSPAQIPAAAPPAEITEERWIDVDLSEQRLTAYEDGVAVRTTLVSTGLPRTPTVQGQFRIWIKLRHDDMEGADYYLEDVPYVMYFYQGYGLHGAPWHNNFGNRMSHGCVNLPVSEAEWLFNFVDVGTLVNVRE